GAIANGDTGDVACDHYLRFREDVGLMRELGLPSYRFSIAWSRVLPDGRGRANTKGLDFYERLTDLLLEAGIQPFVTLHHWDLPAALDDRGGWTNRDSVEWFADYAHVMFESLADRVTMWSTLNEPFMMSHAGYVEGVHAPGHRSLSEAAAVARHLLLAHGAAVRVFRGVGRGSIGLVVNLEPKHPASDDASDVAAAKRADAYMNFQYLD